MLAGDEGTGAAVVVAEVPKGSESCCCLLRTPLSLRQLMAQLALQQVVIHSLTSPRAVRRLEEADPTFRTLPLHPVLGGSCHPVPWGEHPRTPALPLTPTGLGEALGTEDALYSARIEPLTRRQLAGVDFAPLQGWTLALA